MTDDAFPIRNALDFRQQIGKVRNIMPLRISGQVSKIVGLRIECEGLSVPVGALCEISCRATGKRMDAEVIGFRDERALLMPYGAMHGIGRYDPVRLVDRTQKVAVGPSLLGRVLDGRGRPVDGKGALITGEHYPIFAPAPDALDRPRVRDTLSTGIKVIDGLFTIGIGQRMGIFSGSGVGKSMLMGMIARNSSADVAVIALVGERGRELGEFLERDLGADGLRRSVVVVSTSDKPALERVQCIFTATAIAEYFRDQGHNVLLMADSITRVALSQREIGLSAGEPPATKGYTPSVFNLLPRFLERSGNTPKGAITALYTVLVEGDDVTDPIADAVRGIIDGHIWLSRKIANRGHYPAIDIQESISRCAIDVTSPEHQQAAIRVKEMVSVHHEAEDLINIGAYAAGSNPKIDQAIAMYDAITAFRRQWYYESFDLPETVSLLLSMFPDLAEKAQASLATTTSVERHDGAPASGQA